MEYELKVASFDILYAFINYQKFNHERLSKCGNVFTRLEVYIFARLTSKFRLTFLCSHSVHTYLRGIIFYFATTSTDFDLRCAEP